MIDGEEKEPVVLSDKTLKFIREEDWEEEWGEDWKQDPHCWLRVYQNELVPEQDRVLTAEIKRSIWRNYYRANRGFDPVRDSKPVLVDGERIPGRWAYEEEFSLDEDPVLKNAGIRMFARIEFSVGLDDKWDRGEVHNRIVFRKGDFHE